MTAPTVVDVAVNPNNSAQRYVLWGNGRVDAQGGAPAITSGPSWFDRTDQPVGQAIHITNWTTGAGYVLDVQGGFQPLNGAPEITTQSGDTYVNSNGLPYVPERRYVDWSWKPDGSGQGYAVTYWGELLEFGGAPDAPRLGPRFTAPVVKQFEMYWAPDANRAITMDLHGGLHRDFNTPAWTSDTPYFPRKDVARDLVVTDWATGGGQVKGYILTGDGAVHAFGGAAGSGLAGPYRKGQDLARTLHVLSAANPLKFWQVHAGGQSFDYVSSSPPTVTAGGGVSEVQKVTITGSPTGGNFTLTFNGATTATIAYNATAATVQTRLQALSTIGSGNATVTGNAGGPYTVTFAGALSVTDVAQMTAASALTGGTSPAVTVTTTTAGVTSSPRKTVTTTTRPTLGWGYSDPQSDSQAAYEVLLFTQAFADANTMTDPLAHKASALAYLTGVDPMVRGVVADRDLANGTYRFYVRAQDAAGEWSPWSNHGWTQNVAVPATPTSMTATANQGAYRVDLSVAATAGDFVRFEYSDDGGTTWAEVRGAEALPRTATTTGADYDAPFTVTRTYRAVAYSTDPRTASAPSSTASATLTARVYALTAVSDATLGGRMWVQEPVAWSRPVVAGVFEGIGSQYPIVVSDGTPKARRFTLRLATLDEDGWATVRALVEANDTLVYRDPHGEVAYCRVVGDWGRTMMGGAALQHLHTTELPLVEVAAPRPA